MNWLYHNIFCGSVQKWFVFFRGDFSDLHRCNNKNLRYSCRLLFFNETCVKSLFKYKTDKKYVGNKLFIL